MTLSARIGILGTLLCLLGSGCRDSTHVSSSMAPTIKQGETVEVNYTAYTVAVPKRWDVVAFEPPMFTNQVWLMRIIGLPGESVVITNNKLVVNGTAAAIPAQISNVTYLPLGQHAVTSSFKVPQNCYFVLGDNSQTANDSRYWGALPRSNIRGRVR